MFLDSEVRKGDGSYRYEGGEFNLLVKEMETGKGDFETEYSYPKPWNEKLLKREPCQFTIRSTFACSSSEATLRLSTNSWIADGKSIPSATIMVGGLTSRLMDGGYPRTGN
ncbi:uncharacterized protein EAE98_009753 [Botrytis deweyae]|uniref:Uncharacterized protein n=1 Tax=Botrytis deweyae TaxID=2478750 RepID=A0ABQ7IAS7_9HELO|nr:uncharacterized protein EAE98_009753 [Botrytis deweyae]KAF7918510.1 hypothetical protein EAE98_009753 [Botrytis deweyae]